MKLIKIKKESLYVALFLIGVIAFVSPTLGDLLKGKVVKYGLGDIPVMLLGVIYAVSGLSLLGLDRNKIYRRKGFFSKRANFIRAGIIYILVASSCWAAGFVHSNFYWAPKVTRNIKGWSIGIYKSLSQEPFCFIEQDVNNPVLTANDITDVRAAEVADPFLICENDTYYMFFELVNVATSQGDIGLAISSDGENWSYSQIVLDERFHLSYPCVFKWQDEYYMIPESGEVKSIRLYKAEQFPYQWLFIKTLLEGEDFQDNTIFHYGGSWWLFTETGNDDVLRLYYATTPLGPWTEHPESPIVQGDANIARPGGRVVVFDSRVVRYAQDCDPYYGNQVWAFEITKLTPESYEEKRIFSKPILKGFDNWNTGGMHHISPYKLDSNTWIAAVDGAVKGF